MTDRAKIASLADRLERLLDDHKDDMQTIKEQAEAAEVDFAGIKRLVAWRRKDATKRAEQEAIDEQYRFLAGERDEPAELPPGGELAEAARYYADGMTVRQVAKLMQISVGKAQKLRSVAALFSAPVHVQVNVNAPEPTLPPHDAETGELVDDGGEPAADVPRETDDMPAKLRDRIAGALTERYGAEAVKVGPQGVEVSITVPASDAPDPGPIPDFLRRERATA